MTLEVYTFSCRLGLSLRFAFTRVPIVDAAATHTPSLLDYFLQKKNIIHDAWLDWSAGVGDHALVAEVQGVMVQRPPRRGKWHCRDWQSALNWMSDNASQMAVCTTAADCKGFFASAQAALHDK